MNSFMPPQGTLRTRSDAAGRWLIAIAVMSSAVTELVDTSAVNVSLPYIAGNLSASVSEATWVLTSYLVADAAVPPITGWLANYMGRKRLLMLVVTLFTVSSVPIRPGDHGLHAAGRNSDQPPLGYAQDAFLGALTAAAGLFGFSLLKLSAGPWNFVLPEAVMGLGFSFIFVPLATITVDPIPAEQMGYATSIIALMRNLGDGPRDDARYSFQHF